MIRNENVQKKAQRCYLHPRENAVGVCSVCNRPVCGKCSKIRERKQVCRNCSDKKPVARDEV
jgi:hypothetical protein